MFAVINAGGHQYRVAPGDSLRVEKMPGVSGDKVVFDKVLMLGGDKLGVGAP